MGVGVGLAGGRVGPGLAQGAGAAVPWYLAGGAPTPIAAYQPKGAASLAASYVNLANPGTYDAAPGVAPTWNAATGWTFGGTGQWLNTGVPSASENTLICAMTDGASNSMFRATLIGVHCLGNAILSLWHNDSLTHKGMHASYGHAAVAPQITNGVMAVTRNGMYLNGALETALPGTLWGQGALAGAMGKVFYLGATHWFREPPYFDNDTAQYFAKCTIKATAIWTATLTDAQVAAVSAAMAAL